MRFGDTERLFQIVRKDSSPTVSMRDLYMKRQKKAVDGKTDTKVCAAISAWF